MVVGRAPVVDPGGHAVGPERVGDGPGLPDVLPPAGPAGQDDEPAAEPLEVGQIAAPTRCGQRQSSARALKAPIEAPATTTERPPPRSLRIAGRTSWATAWWNWSMSHNRYAGSPRRATSA